MNPLRVLLVDDDFSLLQTLADYIRSALLTIVYTATSVPDAITQIDTHGPFDVLISDYQLPPHTARDLAQHLREAHDRTPLIIHTGFTGVDESHFKSDHYIGLVQKPGHRELIRLILDRFPHAQKS